MSRASPLRGCSPGGGVKVNKWFPLCDGGGNGTPTSLHGADGRRGRKHQSQKNIGGELGARPAVQGKPWTAFLLRRRAVPATCGCSFLTDLPRNERIAWESTVTSASARAPAHRAGLQFAAGRAGADRHLRGGPSRQFIPAHRSPVPGPADQCAPSSRSATAASSTSTSRAFTSPLTYAFLHGSIAHLAINMIWLAAFGSPLANRMGAAEIPVVLGIHVAGRRRLALRAAHARPGAADRRFGRHLGDDGRGSAIRLPHRPQPRPRGLCRSAAADRRVPALARRRHLPGDLDGRQPGDRADRLCARHRRPDRLGGAYRRLPRRFPRHRLVRPQGDAAAAVR